jgi:hypothetical protein
MEKGMRELPRVRGVTGPPAGGSAPYAAAAAYGDGGAAATPLCAHQPRLCGAPSPPVSPASRAPCTRARSPQTCSRRSSSRSRSAASDCTPQSMVRGSGRLQGTLQGARQHGPGRIAQAASPRAHGRVAVVLQCRPGPRADRQPAARRKRTLQPGPACPPPPRLPPDPRPTAFIRVRPAAAGEGRYFVRVPKGTNASEFVVKDDTVVVDEEDMSEWGGGWAVGGVGWGLECARAHRWRGCRQVAGRGWRCGGGGAGRGAVGH